MTQDLHKLVCQVIQQVLQESAREIESIDSSDTLRETLQLDSLDLAIVVVRLEQELGVDPFRRRRSPVRNVGELVGAYEQELHPPA